MEKKPLDVLISATGIWMSRAGVLHKIKHNEVSKRKIYLEMECGGRLVVNNSRNSRTARALRHYKYRKTCKQCRISDEDIANFLTKVNENKSQVKVKVVSAPKVASAHQVKKNVPKSAAKTPRWFENQSSSKALISTPEFSSAFASSSPSAFLSVSSSVSSSASSFGSAAKKIDCIRACLASVNTTAFTRSQLDRLETLLSPQDEISLSGGNVFLRSLNQNC